MVGEGHTHSQSGEAVGESPLDCACISSLMAVSCFFLSSGTCKQAGNQRLNLRTVQHMYH